ncbi:hypothetical protein LWI28_001849 [Acer negundo]|uniref:Uncharacterized protein n=1 Tax=Acer negundo TaxID=4023 RepID=A0AAD5NQH3_ACENE|nr:hypothetical protein LWI28_001849 [Acer negundo]
MLLTCMFYFAGHFRLSSHSKVSGPAQENKRKQSQLNIQVGSIYSSTPPYSHSATRKEKPVSEFQLRK